jgi:hypothetical protein
MKTTILTVTLIITVAIALIFCAPPKAAPGGTYCADVGADATRVEEAYGSILGLKNPDGTARPATTEEINAAVFDWLEGSTHDYERRKNMASYTPPPFGNAKKYQVASPTPSQPKK